MFKKFISLQWKSFFRSASLGKSIGVKIFLGFFAIYFIVVFLMMGVGSYPLLKKLFPDEDPLVLVNRFAVYWLASELVLRFFMQTLPVMDVKPMLSLPIRKKVIVHYVLLKSLFSVYNIFPILVIVPFGIWCIKEGGYSVLGMIGWMATMFCLMLAVNYANFLLKKKFAENLKGLVPYALLLAVIVALDYFNVFKLTALSEEVFNFLVANPITVLVAILLPVGLYFWNFNYLKSRFHLDASLKGKTTEVKTTDLEWTRRFGDIAPFLQQDLKLIWRNKRTKTTVWLSFFFLLYGLLFYPQEVYQNMPAFLVFVGIFITGIFMINFGQFIPAWDSAYYSMMMSQNIPLKKYLEAKAGLMAFSIVVFFLLSTPYAYFGWNILLLNAAAMLYNLGVNIPILLYAGSFNRKRIDLEKSPFMNYQGTGATQWLVGIPLLLLPILIWYVIYFFVSANIATLVLGGLGLVGIILRSFFMDRITKAYRNSKYAMIAGFKQQSA